MIFVDTSIWVDFLRGRNQALIQELRGLLDADRVAMSIPVRCEIVTGASRDDRAKVRRVLSALPIHYPSAETWTLMEQWIETAARAGERFGMGDLLIAAIASEQGAEIWSHDADFQRMEKLGFVRLHAPAKK